LLYGDDIIDHEKSAAQQLMEVFVRKNTPLIASVDVADADVPYYGMLESHELEKDIFLISQILEKPQVTDTQSRSISAGKFILTPDIFHYLQQVVK